MEVLKLAIISGIFASFFIVSMRSSKSLLVLKQNYSLIETVQDVTKIS